MDAGQNYELQLKQVELFNTHQAGTRSQAEFLAKSVFLLAGGALSVSMTLFLGKDAPKMPVELLAFLRLSWLTLFTSMAGCLIALFMQILRDYLLGERWRSKLLGVDVDATGKPGWTEALIWLIGTISLVCFLFGFGVLAFVSSVMVGKTPAG